MRGVVIGAAGGILWGVMAAAVFTAMRAHILPAPSEVALPLAVALILAYLPFNAAIGISVLLNMRGPSFVDVIGLTIACGAAMGITASWLLARARQSRHRAEARR